MNKRFGLYLTMIFISFSLVISFSSAFFDYQQLKEQIHLRHDHELETVEHLVVNSLHTIDEVYSVTDQENAERMKANTDVLLNLYEQDSNFNNWNFEKLKNQFDMEIFIINKENVVIHSSYEEDIGLDFEKCCKGFAKQLTKKRLGTSFNHDGIDVFQATGELKKFSYMPTPDNEYLLELSVDFEDEEIFKQFNFEETTTFLETEYAAIDSIQVYSSSGIVLGQADGNVEKIAEARTTIFQEALHKMKTTSLEKETEDGKITYRYIPYSAGERYDYPIKRVVEVVYNEVELKGLLNFYQNEFIYQQLFIFVLIVILSIVISLLISKPVHLAFHDSLTGLKNRAAFEDEIKKSLRRESSVALMNIDIDNFKLVNDKIGHAAGDEVLVHTAKILQKVIREEDLAARIGGDEFVIVFSAIQHEEMKRIAQDLIEHIQKDFELLHKDYNINISISIGIAFAAQNEKMNTLYDKADKALYISKENGKNQYTIHE